MAAALAASGHELEAALLTGEQEAWVSATLPTGAQPGDLWLDTVELMPMLHFADDEGQPFGWLALRPVERWQFAAFRDLAWNWRFGRIGALKPMDPERLLAGDENAAVTHILHDEAELYANWFGKMIPHRAIWQIAAETLDTDPLWGPVQEWADSNYDGAYRVVDARLIDFDPDSDEEPPALVLDAADAPPGVGFRTFVRADTGLYPEVWPSETYGLRIGKPAKR